MRVHAVLPVMSSYPVRNKTRQAMDDLAEAMANGAPSISEVARTMRIDQRRANELWQRIRAELGPQAV